MLNWEEMYDTRARRASGSSVRGLSGQSCVDAARQQMAAIDGTWQNATDWQIVDEVCDNANGGGCSIFNDAGNAIRQCLCGIQTCPVGEITVCNGRLTYPQITAQLQAAGYPGPWDIPSVVAAYNRTAVAATGNTCTGGGGGTGTGTGTATCATDIRKCDPSMAVITCSSKTATMGALVLQLTNAGYGGPWDPTSAIAKYNQLAAASGDCTPGTGGTGGTGGGGTNIPWVPIAAIAAIGFLGFLLAGSSPGKKKILVAKDVQV